MTKAVKEKGRRLTHMLRHAPEQYNVNMQDGGWVPVWEVLASLELDLADLADIVKQDNKGRFALEGGRIRANQGHSIEVDLGLMPIEPPKSLYHGTVKKFIPHIRKDGLLKMSRHHVHLSEDLDTATQVASRRDTENVLLTIDSIGMFDDGYKFYKSENGVWLTDTVPSKYILS